MATKKSPAKVLNDDDIDGETSASSLPDSAPLTKRDAAKLRHVSLKQCAVLLNRDRNSVQKYLDQGMPAVERADRDRGVAWVLDMAELVRWLDERSAKHTSERLGGSKDGQIDEDEAKRRRAVAQAFTAELEYAESARMVARIHDMLDLVRRDYSEISLRLRAVPDAIASKVDPKSADKVSKTSQELIAQTLHAPAAVKEIEKIAAEV